MSLLQDRAGEVPSSSPARPAVPVDQLGRRLRDLRLSVTDRCNFRCGYCMPREKFGADHVFLPRDQILSFDELVRTARLFVERGVRKIRVTGGEPLLRRDLPVLIAQLRELGSDLDLALTTNGSLLPKYAADLAAAGLNRVTVSLDSLDDHTFRAMTDSKFGVEDVLAGIEAAAAAGLGPLKINAVVQKGMNVDEHLNGVLDVAEHFRFTGHVVRFIEFMDVGASNEWRRDQVVPSSKIVAAIAARHELEPVAPATRGEVANRYRYLDGGGEVGVISSVTSPFCGDCTRARLSADGQIFPCLFASSGLDLRARLRNGSDDDQLRDLLSSWWSARADRYSELRGRNRDQTPRVEMSFVGG